MRLSRVYTLVAVAVLLVVLSLVFVFVGMATPSESFDEQSGLGKVFASSPEFEFDSGSLVMTCGKYSLSLNFGFNKPALSIFAESGVVHINVLVLLVIFMAMVASCAIPEISIGTSCVVAVMVGIASVRMLPIMSQQIADGVPAWDVAAGGFWFVSFIFSALIVNGLIGVGGKVMRLIFFEETARIIVTLLLSLLVANAVAVVLALLFYLTVGLGFCGGIIIWFVVAVLFAVFCEVMDIAAL